MKSLHKDTQAIKSVQPSHDTVKPVSMPIYLTSTYEREPDGSYDGDLVYSRNGNPNRNTLEQSIAMLEGGEIAFAFSSGMAAISSVLQSLKSGDHILLPDDVYYNIKGLLNDTYARWGLSYTLVDMSDTEAVKAAIRDSTALIWMETPSNPMLKITDIKAVSQIANERNILTAVDNTWATPVLLNPIALGADMVVHSTTKYFGGHSDVLNGAVVCKGKGTLADNIKNIQVGGGAVPSPFDCWLVSRGVATLGLRVRAQSATASLLADHLDKHELIEKVYYPGLSTHAGHDIAREQMKGHYGAMLSILVKGGEGISRKVANSLNLFTQATSLGGVESLVEHRRSVEGPKSKTPENLLRLSVGLEYIDDLIDDFDQALAQ